MRSRYLVAALVAASGLWLVAPAQADEPAAIAVTGEASISVPPDLAEINGGVTTEAKTALSRAKRCMRVSVRAVQSFSQRKH